MLCLCRMLSWAYSFISVCRPFSLPQSQIIQSLPHLPLLLRRCQIPECWEPLDVFLLVDLIKLFPSRDCVQYNNKCKAQPAQMDIVMLAYLEKEYIKGLTPSLWFYSFKNNASSGWATSGWPAVCSRGSLYITTLWLDLHPLMAEALPINLCHHWSTLFLWREEQLKQASQVTNSFNPWGTGSQGGREF